ncbi:MAG TPA: hypothetical protein VHM88_14700 [Candidatus Acidoferrales bacterium]|nr:hypothetical protein [Candidatus Dormibacteraeota bacterium]HEX2713447.1 hypothetical protein [Candidatus Acidoferrales bacterium]
MRLPERGLRWSIRSVEWVSRRIRGIKEFGVNPDVTFRLGIGKAGRVIHLSDGNILQPEDVVGELHLWNEHLLLAKAHRTDLGWAVAIRRRMTESLHDLATYLVADHRFDEVKALRVRPASVDGHREATLRRILARYGFEADREADTRPQPSWLYRYGDNFWLWMLAWTFNPTRSREDWRFDRRRIDFWISRARFIALYRSSAQTH